MKYSSPIIRAFGADPSVRRKTSGLALRRARARRHSAGAVMFIVVVTLGLLAAMGVYGLSATTADVRSAGHMREALQAQKAGEDALIMTAETLNPKAASQLVAAMSSMSSPGRTVDCKTAGPLPAGATKVPPSAACYRLKELDMRNAAGLVTPWAAVPAFAPDSFGAVTSVPNVNVELSDPFPMQKPGFDPVTQPFTQVTVTVFVDVRSTLDPTAPSQAVVSGRGRLTVGPVDPPRTEYNPPPP